MFCNPEKSTRFTGHGIIPDFDVPDLFSDDGASIPGIAEPIIGHDDDPEFKSAARGHDWFYRGNFSPVDLADGSVKCSIALRPSRKQVDNWFLKELARNGVSWGRRTAMYIAVRLFAFPFWKGRSDGKDFDLKAIKEDLWLT